jgi:hypothetical protein
VRRWHEGECGGGNSLASWVIERDADTGKPFLACYPHNAKPYRVNVADRESGALKRVVATCAKNGLQYFVQTDPRGPALYVSTEKLFSANYTNGACCAI